MTGKYLGHWEVPFDSSVWGNRSTKMHLLPQRQQHMLRLIWSDWLDWITLVRLLDLDQRDPGSNPRVAVKLTVTLGQSLSLGLTYFAGVKEVANTFVVFTVMALYKSIAIFFNLPMFRFFQKSGSLFSVSQNFSF